MVSLEDILAFANANPFAVAVAVFVIILPILIGIFNNKPKKPFLDPNAFKPLPLSEKKFITHNTVQLRFRLPHPQQRLGLPIGQHISFRATADDGSDVYRSYTPISDDDQLGSVDFIIKIYPQGKMSQVINKMKIGDTMLMKGPKGRLQYSPNMKKHIGMLAGGTGITPMWQVINAILKNPEDKTQISLLYGNLTAEDILLKAELDALIAAHPKQLKVYHVLNSAPEGWTQGVGFITADMMKTELPAPGPDTLVLRCGPTPMMEVMKRVLGELGHEDSAQFQF